MKPLRKKCNLDEQQERKLLEIESRGFWICFWSMLFVIFIGAISDSIMVMLFTLYALYMGICIYIEVSCSRAGIWHRSLDMNNKTCLITSLFTGLAAGAFVVLFLLVRNEDVLFILKSSSAVATLSFVVCFVSGKPSVRSRTDRDLR